MSGEDMGRSCPRLSLSVLVLAFVVPALALVAGAVVVPVTPPPTPPSTGAAAMPLGDVVQPVEDALDDPPFVYDDADAGVNDTFDDAFHDFPLRDTGAGMAAPP